MVRAVCALLILFSASHVFAAKPGCESHIARGPIAAEIYLRMVRVGLKLGVVEFAGLVEAGQSRRPIDITIAERSPESLAVKTAMARALPHLRVGDWRAIKVQLKIIREQYVLDQAQVDEAKQATKPIYQWRKTPFKMKGIVMKNIVATNGDVFVASSNRDLYIGEIHQPEPYLAKYRPANNEAYDFFETSRGQVLFSTVSVSGVHVIDAQTGADVLNYPLKRFKFPQMQSTIYRSLLFEVNGRVKVALVPTADFLQSTYSAQIPFAIIDVKSRRGKSWLVPSGSGQFVKRLEDGNVYHYGVRSADREVFISNLSTGKIAFRGVAKIGDADVVEGKMTPIPFIDDQKLPQLLFSDSEIHYLYDQNSNLAIPFEKTKMPRQVRVFKDRDGKRKMVGFNQIGEVDHQVHIVPLDGSPALTHTVQTNHPRNTILPPGVIETPRGIVAMFHEITDRREIRVLAVELATGAFFSTPAPRVAALELPFYSPRDNRVYVFASSDANTNMFELWGPDLD